MKPAKLYLGAISGTSVDAMDIALADLGGPRPQLLDALCEPYPDPLRARLLSLGPESPLREVMAADAQVAHVTAHGVRRLLQRAGIAAARVLALGSHGQTIWHAPHADPPTSVQIGDPNRLAELTGIPVVADFRRRDMAAGGQGAPLMPAVHAGLFGGGRYRAVLNLGGIANLTLLPPGGPVTGFDTGPASGLMDRWIRRHQGRPWDAAGAWAASGRPDPELLAALLDDAYFAAPPPKSTGPERFGESWLATRIPGHLAPENVQATLLELTVESVAQAMEAHAGGAEELLVAGGGVHNQRLMVRLAERLPCPVASTAALGVDPDYLEAVGFAWLARATLRGEPGNLPSVTGARAAVVLGGVYGMSWPEPGSNLEG